MTAAPDFVLHLIVLAGGSSTRARRGNSSVPKQFRSVGGQLLLAISVRELVQLPQTASVTVAVPASYRAVTATALPAGEIEVPLTLADAGENRTASTWSAALSVAQTNSPQPDDLVAVHDAARPFATRHLLARVAEAARRHGAAVPGVAVPDTIVRLGESADHAEAVATYLRRDLLQAVQTPQVFRWEPFFAAHQWCAREGRTFTDDGGLLAARGLSPVVVRGEADNWKITTDSDWDRAHARLRRGRVSGSA